MSRIVIIGGGEVGYHIAQRLSHEDWDVSIIDQDEQRIERIANTLDVHVLLGNGSSPKSLKEAGIEDSDLLVAVTDSDEVNIVACLVANIYAPPTCRKIARIRNPEYTDDPKMFEDDRLGIDFRINPESAAARKLLWLLHEPHATEVVHFEGGRVSVVGVNLPEESPLYGKKLMELAALYPERRFLFAAIERDGAILIPKGNDQLQRGDTIFIVTTPDKLKPVFESLGLVKKPIRSVAIAGGGRVGEFLAEELEREGVTVRIFDRDRQRCQELAESLNRTVVLHGDVTDRTLLEEENVGQIDAFIAVTDDEEENILSSLIAKRLGNPKVITGINKISYRPLVRNIGVDVAISPRQVATNQILQFIRKGNVLQVDALGEEQAEMIEFVVGEGAPIVGVPLSLATLPKNSLVGAILTEHSVQIPWGNSVIQPGDRVIVFALEDAISEVEKYFLSS